MARKSSRKSPALLSTLVSAEHAAEGEILETPAVSSLSRAADASDNSDSDNGHDDEDEDDQENEEDEIERRLVEEQLAEQQSQQNERENRGIYNGEALKKLVADYAASTASLAWVETLDVCTHAVELTNVHDDLKREVAFYNNTLASVRHAKDKLKQQNVAYKRPLDYFAEMLKSDAHMAKVKDKLIYEQKKIHAVEERKKSQAHRKVAKEIQAEKAKERLQQKKDTLSAVKEWKKRRNADKGGAIRDDDDRELDEIVAGKTPVAPTGGKRKRDGGRDDRDAKKPRVNAKREAKNKKFGFGGPKKFSKSNTRESTNDTSSFPGRRQRGGAPSGKGGRVTGGKAPKGKRPSKTARTKQRGKR